MAVPNKMIDHLMGLGPTVPVRDGQRLQERDASLLTEADLATTAASVLSFVFVAERPCVVVDAYLVASAAITANDTNNNIITGAKRTVAVPGTPVVFLTATTAITGGTGNVTAGLKTSLKSFFDADPSKKELATGDTMTLQITKNGSITYPGGSLVRLIVRELSD